MSDQGGVCSRLSFKGSIKFCQLDKRISGRSPCVTVQQYERMVCPGSARSFQAPGPEMHRRGRNVGGTGS